MKVKALLTAALGLMFCGVVNAAAVAEPTVSADYQKSFGAAWSKAGEGELPVYECIHTAGLASKAISAGADVQEAQNAYEACYVKAALHYSDAYFKLRNNSEMSEDGKPYGCKAYAKYLNAHVAALASYLDKFELDARALNSNITQQLNETASACQVVLK